MIPPNVGQLPPELDLFAAIVGVFFTIFILSFLWRENPLSRAVEHLFVGLAAVFTFAALYDFAVRGAFLGTNRIVDWYQGVEGAEWGWIFLIPLFIGFMYLFFFTKKYFFLYRYPVAIVAGIQAGMIITGMISANFVIQIHDTVTLPLIGETPQGIPVWEGWPPIGLNSILIIIGVITALSFFFFTWEHRGVLGTSARIGRYFLMATFGSFYGGTVMARMSLLIGRLRFLSETNYPAVEPWYWNWYLVPIAILCVIAVAWYQYTRPPPPEAAPTETKTKKTSET
ncbi:MAG: hypothetical protein JSW13_01890 [Candidatus Aerophobus sp.]|nr:MAG: hypothetical protein JSW13_01890 [Candidatus Aerophobus sp.]